MKLSELTQLAYNILATAGLLVAALLAIRRWLKHWVKGVAEDSREAARQLSTSNGTTVAQYIERMDKQVADVATLAQDSSRRADVAHTLAQHVSGRLDEHLLHHEHKPTI